jgi:hypothetical protein
MKEEKKAGLTLVLDKEDAFRLLGELPEGESAKALLWKEQGKYALYLEAEVLFHDAGVIVFKIEEREFVLGLGAVLLRGELKKRE